MSFSTLSDDDDAGFSFGGNSDKNSTLSSIDTELGIANDGEIDYAQMSKTFGSRTRASRNETRSVSSTREIQDVGDLTVAYGDDNDLDNLFETENLINAVDPCSDRTMPEKAAFALAFLLKAAPLGREDSTIKALLNALTNIIVKFKLDVLPIIVGIENNPIRNSVQCFTVIKSLNAPVGVWDPSSYFGQGIVNADYSRWSIPNVGVVDLEYFPYHFQIVKTDGIVKNNNVNVKKYFKNKTWKEIGDFCTSVAYMTSPKFISAFMNPDNQFKLTRAPFVTSFTEKHGPLQRYIILIDLCAQYDYIPTIQYEIDGIRKVVTVAHFMARKMMRIADLKGALQYAREYRKQTVLDTLLKEVNCFTKNRFAVLGDLSLCKNFSVVTKFDPVAASWEDKYQRCKKAGREIQYFYVGFAKHLNMQCARAADQVKSYGLNIVFGDKNLTDDGYVDLSNCASVKKWFDTHAKKSDKIWYVVHCDTGDKSVTSTNGQTTADHIRNLVLAGFHHVTIKASAWVSYNVAYESQIMTQPDGSIAVGREHNGEIIIQSIAKHGSVVLKSLIDPTNTAQNVLDWQDKQRAANATRGMISNGVETVIKFNSTTMRAKNPVETELSKKNITTSDFIIVDQNDVATLAPVQTMKVCGDNSNEADIIIDLYNVGGYLKIHLPSAYVNNKPKFQNSLRAIGFKFFAGGMEFSDKRDVLLRPHTFCGIQKIDLQNESQLKLFD